jgi:hypothetical protein
VTNLQIVGVGVRVFGIWKLLGTLQLLLAYAPFVLTLNADRNTYFAFLFPMLSLALAAWMVARPIAFARLILPVTNENADAEARNTWSMDELQGVLFSVLGVYFLVSYFQYFEGWLQALSTLRQDQRINWPSVSNTASAIVGICAGLWLLLGAKGLRGFIRKCRTAGS